jgi:hypothetical protein
VDRLTTVTLADDARDTLFGGRRPDWFLAPLSGANNDTIEDPAAGEVVTAL